MRPGEELAPQEEGGMPPEGQSAEAERRGTPLEEQETRLAVHVASLAGGAGFFDN